VLVAPGRSLLAPFDLTPALRSSVRGNTRYPSRTLGGRTGGIDYSAIQRVVPFRRHFPAIQALAAESFADAAIKRYSPAVQGTVARRPPALRRPGPPDGLRCARPPPQASDLNFATLGLAKMQKKSAPTLERSAPNEPCCPSPWARSWPASGLADNPTRKVAKPEGGQAAPPALHPAGRPRYPAGADQRGRRHHGR
jgi:hypothetical protein